MAAEGLSTSRAGCLSQRPCAPPAVGAVSQSPQRTAGPGKDGPPKSTRPQERAALPVDSITPLRSWVRRASVYLPWTR